LDTLRGEDLMDTEAPLIVVVDDDASMSQALHRLLTAAGFRARTYGSVEALAAVDGDRAADCLVLDLHLGGQGGASWYASLPASRPPAVFISAHHDPLSRRTALQAGGHAFIAKPFDGALFLDSIARAMNGHGHRTAAP
jgi:FixJ family two-component response regulator